MPKMTISKSDSIIIIGGGAFGLSTALHLSQGGYRDITVLERDTQIPPRYSAANDLNKIVRAEYEDPFYTDLTIKAIETWKNTPLFSPHFHQVGFLHCVSKNAPEKAVQTLERFRASAERHTDLRRHLASIGAGEDIRGLVSHLKESPVPDWKGYLNRYDGYAHSANALAAVYRETKARGVKFLLGQDGHVKEIIRDKNIAKGIMTASGNALSASLVVVAAGAGVSHMLPRIGQQVTAKSWSVAHVQLSDAEAAKLRGLPVTYARDLGFMFEPDPELNLLKLCPMGGGYINTDSKSGVSLPPSGLRENAFMPPDDEKKVRKLLKETLPELADRPLVRKQLCWFADTADSDFIVDYVPGSENSVMVLSGDSGHGFKMFPIVGEWVKTLIEAKSGKQEVVRWRWKQPKGAGGGTGTDDVSWRVGEVKEFVDIAPSTSKL